MLNIIIILHFHNIYDILQPEGFCDTYNAPNSFFASPPRTPLWELTTLPRVPSWLETGIFSPYFPPRRRLRRLTLSLWGLHQGLRNIDALE